MRKIAIVLIFALCIPLCFAGCCCHHPQGHTHAVEPSDLELNFDSGAFQEVGNRRDGDDWFRYYRERETDKMYLKYSCCSILCGYSSKRALIHDDGTPVLYSEWLVLDENRSLKIN